MAGGEGKMDGDESVVGEVEESIKDRSRTTNSNPGGSAMQKNAAKSSSEATKGNLKRVFADMNSRADSAKADIAKWKCPLCDQLNSILENECHFCQCEQPEPGSTNRNIKTASIKSNSQPRKAQATQAKGKGSIAHFFTTSK